MESDLSNNVTDMQPVCLLLVEGHSIILLSGVKRSIVVLSLLESTLSIVLPHCAFPSQAPPIPSTGAAAVVMFFEVVSLGKQHLMSAAQW